MTDKDENILDEQSGNITSLSGWIESLPQEEKAQFREAQRVLKFVNGAECYLGGRWPAMYLQYSKSLHDVTHVLCLNGRPSKPGNGAKLYVIDIDDLPNEDLLSVIPEAIKFLDEAFHDKGKVLLHCTAGRSRSAGVLVAFMMLKLGMEYDIAVEKIKESRKWIDINIGFEKQLRTLEPTTESKFYNNTCDATCELCELKRTTEWYDEGDGRFVIIECDQCDQPMAVWRDHTMKISEEDAHDMEEALQRVANRVMGGRDKYVITKKQRSIDTHLHWHARDASTVPFWARPGFKGFHKL